MSNNSVSAKIRELGDTHLDVDSDGYEDANETLKDVTHNELTAFLSSVESVDINHEINVKIGEIKAILLLLHNGTINPSESEADVYGALDHACGGDQTKMALIAAKVGIHLEGIINVDGFKNIDADDDLFDKEEIDVPPAMEKGFNTVMLKFLELDKKLSNTESPIGLDEFKADLKSIVESIPDASIPYLITMGRRMYPDVFSLLEDTDGMTNEGIREKVKDLIDSQITDEHLKISQGESQEIASASVSASEKAKGLVELPPDKMLSATQTALLNQMSGKINISSLVENSGGDLSKFRASLSTELVKILKKDWYEPNLKLVSSAASAHAETAENKIQQTVIGNLQAPKDAKVDPAKGVTGAVNKVSGLLDGVQTGMAVMNLVEIQDHPILKLLFDARDANISSTMTGLYESLKNQNFNEGVAKEFIDAQVLKKFPDFPNEESKVGGEELMISLENTYYKMGKPSDWYTEDADGNKVWNEELNGKEKAEFMAEKMRTVTRSYRDGEWHKKYEKYVLNTGPESLDFKEWIDQQPVPWLEKFINMIMDLIGPLFDAFDEKVGEKSNNAIAEKYDSLLEQGKTVEQAAKDSANNTGGENGKPGENGEKLLQTPSQLAEYEKDGFAFSDSVKSLSYGNDKDKVVIDNMVSILQTHPEAQRLFGSEVNLSESPLRVLTENYTNKGVLSEINVEYGDDSVKIYEDWTTMMNALTYGAAGGTLGFALSRMRSAYKAGDGGRVKKIGKALLNVVNPGKRISAISGYVISMIKWAGGGAVVGAVANEASSLFNSDEIKYSDSPGTIRDSIDKHLDIVAKVKDSLQQELALDDGTTDALSTEELSKLGDTNYMDLVDDLSGGEEGEHDFKGDYKPTPQDIRNFLQYSGEGGDKGFDEAWFGDAVFSQQDIGDGEKYFTMEDGELVKKEVSNNEKVTVFEVDGTGDGLWSSMWDNDQEWSDKHFDSWEAFFAWLRGNETVSDVVNKAV